MGKHSHLLPLIHENYVTLFRIGTLPPTNNRKNIDLKCVFQGHLHIITSNSRHDLSIKGKNLHKKQMIPFSTNVYRRKLRLINIISYKKQKLTSRCHHLTTPRWDVNLLRHPGAAVVAAGRPLVLSSPAVAAAADAVVVTRSPFHAQLSFVVAAAVVHPLLRPLSPVFHSRPNYYYYYYYFLLLLLLHYCYYYYYY